MQKSVNLTCQVISFGCRVTNVDWTGPDGNTINSINASKYSLKDRLVNTVIINDAGQYTCTITHTGGSTKGVYTYTGWYISGMVVRNK